MRKIYGVYSDLAQARKVLGDLMNCGCGEDDVRIVSNTDSESNLENDRDLDGRSLNNFDKSIIEAYNDEIKAGKTLILIGEDIDLDIDDPSRYNTSKEEIDKRNIDRNPLDKPYPEELNYEIEEDKHNK